MNKFLKIILLVVIIIIIYVIYRVPLITDTYQMGNPTVLCLEQPCPTITVTEKVTVRDYIERRI